MTAYITPAEMQTRYDWHEIGDLLSDSNEQVSALDQVTTGNRYYTVFTDIINDACGDVEAALLSSGRYATTDLSGLTGNSASLLKRITGEIAIAYLYERKPLYRPERLEQYSKSKAAHLERLASGVNVFNLPSVVAAGGADVSGPTTFEYQQLNLISDRAKGYPRRRLPNDR